MHGHLNVKCDNLCFIIHVVNTGPKGGFVVSMTGFCFQLDTLQKALLLQRKDQQNHDLLFRGK
jgi:hypothetical protein